jgi:hypothetical protein
MVPQYTCERLRRHLVVRQRHGRRRCGKQQRRNDVVGERWILFILGKGDNVWQSPKLHQRGDYGEYGPIKTPHLPLLGQTVQGATGFGDLVIWCNGEIDQACQAWSRRLCIISRFTSCSLTLLPRTLICQSVLSLPRAIVEKGVLEHALFCVTSSTFVSSNPSLSFLQVVAADFFVPSNAPQRHPDTHSTSAVFASPLWISSPLMPFGL